MIIDIQEFWMEKENDKLLFKGGYSGTDEQGTLGTWAQWR